MKDARFTLGGHEIRVLDGPYVAGGKPTEAAREFASTLIGLLDDMRVFAAKRYLKTYNETWREDGNPMIGEREFCTRLTNPAIVLYDEIGAATVYFRDSDMFGGHSIEVSIDDGKIAHASMVG